MMLHSYSVFPSDLSTVETSAPLVLSASMRRVHSAGWRVADWRGASAFDLLHSGRGMVRASWRRGADRLDLRAVTSADLLAEAADLLADLRPDPDRFRRNSYRFTLRDRFGHTDVLCGAYTWRPYTCGFWAGFVGVQQVPEARGLAPLFRSSSMLQRIVSRSALAVSV